MSKYQIKTIATNENVNNFLNQIEDLTKRQDSILLCNLMSTATNQPAVMWGTSIVGFGQYHYVYESGHEGDMCIVGFSPRKNNIVLYLVDGGENHTDLLQKLGNPKIGKSCVYFKTIHNLDQQTLVELIKQSYQATFNKYNK